MCVLISRVTLKDICCWDIFHFQVGRMSWISWGFGFVRIREMQGVVIKISFMIDHHILRETVFP